MATGTANNENALLRGHRIQSHLFAQDQFARMYTVILARATRHKRWRGYIYKQKTLNELCKQIIGNNPPRQVTVAYGVGRFKHNSKGYNLPHQR